MPAWMPKPCKDASEHRWAPRYGPEWIYGCEVQLVECMRCWTEIVEPTWRMDSAIVHSSRAGAIDTNGEGC